MKLQERSEAHKTSKKFVFQFWHDGEELAPPLVRSCIQTWRVGCERAGFEHVMISRESLDFWESKFPDFLRVRLRNFRDHAQCWPDAKWRRYSDMLRLALLSSFNGIWADSTLLLTKPIEEWLPDPGEAGGLQLCKGVTDRLIENWFICSLDDSPLLNDWLEHYVRYNTTVQLDASQYLAKRLSIPGLMFRIQHQIPRAKTWWFKWPLQNIHRRHPYFANYYSFEYVLNRLSPQPKKHHLFLPYDLVGWDHYNSNQQSNWVLKDFDRTLLRSLMLLPFIKLDWKRCPGRLLDELDEDNLLRHFWETSQAELTKTCDGQKEEG